MRIVFNVGDSYMQVLGHWIFNSEF